jgi:hypothetical protein
MILSISVKKYLLTLPNYGLLAIQFPILHGEADGIIKPGQLIRKEENMKKTQAQKRLAYLRKEIEAKRISYGKIAELQSLKRFIDKSDVLLLQWAGVREW